MKGFMCHSTAATAVCMATADSRSVFVPRRPHTTLINNIDDHTRLVANANYSRLVNKSHHSNRFVSPTNNSSIKRDLPRPKPLNKLSTTVASSDQVFQVVVMRVSLHCHGCAGKGVVKDGLMKSPHDDDVKGQMGLVVGSKDVDMCGEMSPKVVGFPANDTCNWKKRRGRNKLYNGKRHSTVASGVNHGSEGDRFEAGVIHDSV
ncbi:hypothetical protein EZV62_019113 [Acer yangbiense]|uniref:Uncharacterized protein n=1 Tax=Acer yangbiense TaxID=1000413 RepID=A0A5C7HAH0_9ROSI|nr:hypothetical protein EZV62_019113 [Acer yangbiense]